MFTVENSARGNCMYEAYSISLMYFLRSKNDAEITETVLNKFGLTDSEKSALLPLLTQNREEEFSKEHIRTLIEPVLATKVRALGARVTRENFITSPADTGLYTAAQYGLEYYFKIGLRNHPENDLIENDFKRADFIRAEIYNVKNIRTDMMNFAQEKSNEVHAKYEEEWNRIKDFTEEKDYSSKQKEILTTLISEKTIEFFTENNYRNLDAYVALLGTNFIWGTEETLLLINSAVQGERFIRNDDDRIDIYCDTVIKLEIHINNAPPNYPSDDKPDIILNNHGNVHWNSRIPDYIFTPKPVVKDVNQENKIQVDPDEELAKKMQAEFDNENKKSRLADELVVKKRIEEVIQRDKLLAEKIDAEQRKTKCANLEIIENKIPDETVSNAQKRFDNALNALKNKMINLHKREKNATKEGNPKKAKSYAEAFIAANTLYDELTQAKTIYFANPAKESYQVFKKTCDASIQKSRNVLERHRGWKGILINIALAVIGLGVLYVVAGAINKATTGHFLFFKTASGKILDELKKSVDDATPSELKPR